jgi:hypothetical protein
MSQSSERSWWSGRGDACPSNHARTKVCANALLIASLSSGCSMFRSPPLNAHGPTLPTGSYDSLAEKWADESTAAQRKNNGEKMASDLKKLDR